MGKKFIVLIIAVSGLLFACNVSVGNKKDAFSHKDSINNIKDNSLSDSKEDNVTQTEILEISLGDTIPTNDLVESDIIVLDTCDKLWQCVKDCGFSKGCIKGCQQHATKGSISGLKKLIECIEKQCHNMDKFCVRQAIKDQCSGEFYSCVGTCIPKTCNDVECGKADDGCGGTIDCGNCKDWDNNYICYNNKCIDKNKCNHNGTCEPSLGEDCETCSIDCGCDPNDACVDSQCVSGKSCSKVLDCIMSQCLSGSNASDDCVDNCTKYIRVRDRKLLYELGDCVEQACPDHNDGIDCPINAMNEGGACHDQYKACENSK